MSRRNLIEQSEGGASPYLLDKRFEQSAMDPYSRRMVGWALVMQAETERVIQALEHARRRRRRIHSPAANLLPVRYEKLIYR